jgi:transcriptional regulator with XRE-family HTH domain
VSNPYLSQVERGLRKPSAEVLQQIARGLRISAEALYVRAGILDEEGRPDVEAAIHADPELSERQRRVLLDIYASFRAENRRAADAPDAPARPRRRAAATSASERATARVRSRQSRKTPAETLAEVPGQAAPPAQDVPAAAREGQSPAPGPDAGVAGPPKARRSPAGRATARATRRVSTRSARTAPGEAPGEAAPSDGDGGASSDRA